MAPVVKKIGGFWGAPTSTLDWCEENYAVTNFIAEFWNTLSNWIMIVPPLLGMMLAWQTRRELRYRMSFFILSIVGIGSLCFHATLLFEMQLLDELPMIYCSCVYLYCIMECDSDSGRSNLSLVAKLILTSLLISLVYVTVKNPLLFQYTYGILVTSCTILAFAKYRKYQASTLLLAISVTSYLTGFMLWNYENNYCSSVRNFRTNAIAPFRPFTQLHAVWHILAGIGSYVHILFSLDLRFKCQGQETQIKLVWGWLPFIYPKGKAKTDNI